MRRDSLFARLFNSRKKLLSSFVLVMFALSVFASTFMLSPSVRGNPAFGDPGFIAYRSSSGAGVSIPKYRSWSADTNTWASESALATAGSPVRWVRVAYSPNVTRREERIVVTLSDNGDLYAYVWTGAAWSQTLIASVGTTVNAYRCFDIAYEMKTGRALVVYSRDTATFEIGYRIWNGVSWTSEAQLEARTTGVVNWIALASAPGTRIGTGDDNEIAMIYLAADPAVHGYVWTGAAWSEMGVAAIWDTSIAIATEESIAVAYEQNSGKAMFIWADSVITDFYYRVWSGTTLSGPTLRDIPGSDGLGNWLSLKSSPSSNGLLFGVVDAGSDLNTAYWSGTTWTVHTEHDGTVDTHAQRCFDVEWAADGTHAMLLWGTTLSVVSWRKLTPPNTWTSTATEPAEGLSRSWVQLRRPPYPIRAATGNAPQIVGATLDALLDIDIFQWDGSAWTRTADITTDTGVSTYECFEVEFQSINPKVTVSPASIIDTGATYAPQTPIIINPDGDGTFADWTGSYTDWDDWPAHDGDTTYVSSTVDYSYQSSTLSDPAGPPTWTIAKVKIYIVARNTDPDSDDELIPLLVIGGYENEGKRFTPTSTYETYTTEWAMNPDTGSFWTWADIADLEAGALSSQYGFWPGELRVTQLYVEITGPRLSVDIRVDYVRDLWLFEFELTYNPDLLKGVYYDEAWGWPVKVGDFIGSAGGSVSKNGGIGWNNTLGKLWLNGAFLTGTSPANCPDGNGILATVVFEVVAQGETTLHLGELTGLMYPPPPDNNYMAQGLAFVEDGYFRNVDSSQIPTASFDVDPQNPSAGLVEGQEVIFTSTSTAPGVKTIDTYKWYFYETLQDTLYRRFATTVLRPDNNGTYTDWAGYARDWDDITPGGDGDETHVKATAGENYESSTLPDSTETRTIDKVRLSIVARNNETSDEIVQPMLVVGGTRYYGAKYTPSTTYSTYSSEWSTNPATGSRWTWAAVNALEAGVRSEQVGGSWTGELRVTQLLVEVLSSPLVMSESTVTQNFTLRGTSPVTHTVIDSDGVVGSTTVDVLIKAHDIFVKTITTNASYSKYPIGTPYIDLGETVQIDVLVENQGDFSETFDLKAYWTNPFGPVGSIGTHAGVSLGIGTSTTRTFYWTPTGAEFCIIHALPFDITVNTSIVQYEYDKGDNTNTYSGPRIRHHNLAVSQLETASALVLKPNGNGADTGWTGTYTDWYEWPTHDSDSTYVSATAGNLYESSLLTDHTSEAWTISKVRLKVFAKNTVSSNETIQLMLVVGATRYPGTLRFTPTTAYAMYSYDWPTNPSTGAPWTWPQIDGLVAGVRSEQTNASWTGELRVTQLYVEVLGTPTNDLFSTTGQWVAVLATVANEGDYNQTDIDVTTYYDSTIPATAPAQRIPLLTNSSLAISFAGLGIKSSETLSFIWDTTAVPWGTCTIKANATIAGADVKPRDNTRTGPGDVNGDGWVDVDDLALMHEAFGSKPGDSNWIASADLNNDSIVNVDDLRLLGKSYWPPTP